jgi:hypothetical protein
MDVAIAIDEVLAILAGELRDSSGAVLVAPLRRPQLVEPHTTSVAAVSTALASGGRVAALVMLPPPSGVVRMFTLLRTRLRLAGVRRWLQSAGANRVRMLAVVPGRETLFLVYELGGTVQPYVEEELVLQSQRQKPWVDVAKAVLRGLVGVETSVEFVVVVGERV